MPRKPKPLPPPVSKYHPLRIQCPLCGAEPFLVCTKTKGDGWTEWTLGLWHQERAEASKLDELFD